MIGHICPVVAPAERVARLRRLREDAARRPDDLRLRRELEEAEREDARERRLHPNGWTGKAPSVRAILAEGLLTNGRLEDEEQP